MIHALLVVGLACAAIDSRTMLLAARGGMAGQMANRNFLIVLIGGISLPALIALIAVGFLFFTWYIWIGILVFSFMFLALIVNSISFPALYSASPILNITTIIAATFGWLSWLELL